MSPSLRDRALRRARGVVSRVRGSGTSVVIEARGREADVRASIDSARDHPDPTLEILVVLVEEHLRLLAQEADAGDRRVRVVPAFGADPAAARRTGAEAARGSRLVFLPPRQELLHVALALLEGASCPVVVAEAELEGTTGLSCSLGRLLVPRETWLASEDDGEPAGQTAALRLLRDQEVATLRVATVRDRGPLRPRPFEPQVDPLPGLAARIDFDQTMLSLGGDRARIAAGLLARDLPPFLDAVERCDDDRWGALQAHAADLVREAGDALAEVPVEDRVLAWLAAEGRRADLVAYVASRRFSRGQFPTTARDGQIHAELGVVVPDRILVVAEAESALRVRVEHAASGSVVLWTAIARLDQDDPQVLVTVAGHAVEVERSCDPAVTRWMGESFQCHDQGVVRVTLPSGTETSALEVDVLDRGVRRRAPVEPEADSPAGRTHPDLADDEAGPYRQHLLQREYAATTEPLDPKLVYFQAFLGQAPTDHPGAIQQALQRVRPEGVRMLWGVADAGVPVPEGAEPVQLRSRAWYDALARATWVITNVELEPWFVRRDDQQVLQTYHGYPSKLMGLSQWRARDLTATHVEELLRRTSGTWNTLLTPIPEMDAYYRDNYAFDGRIISQGYPRDDSLVAPGHGRRRQETRELLGIGPGQTAILYAPTWRDDLATNFRRAPAVLHLDVGRTARELGPDHVVLLRGHRFHAATAGSGQVVDVTGHPEVNDLLLAADAAVLDYSSLRFDFSLTGRPMVFLVPDLEDYAGRTRGFLYPFEDSAPGPLLRTTDEVVAALRDLPALEREWGPRIAELNATYQPTADGRAGERVVAEFFAPLLEAT
jgi:CDP-glycerol glycerophosphotransferase (TagB/SpsB family)